MYDLLCLCGCVDSCVMLMLLSGRLPAGEPRQLLRHVVQLGGSRVVCVTH